MAPTSWGRPLQPLLTQSGKFLAGGSVTEASDCRPLPETADFRVNLPRQMTAHSRPLDAQGKAEAIARLACKPDEATTGLWWEVAPGASWVTPPLGTKRRVPLANPTSEDEKRRQEAVHRACEAA